MKKIKSAFIVFICCVLIFSFASCGKSGQDNSNNQSNESSKPQTSTQDTSKDPMDTTGLLSNDMPQLCKPVATGDFIQPGYCQSWLPKKWVNHFKRLKDAGIDKFILQGSFSFKDGKFNNFWYNSKLANDKSISQDNCNVYPDLLENILKAAESEGIKVYIGLGCDDNWWNTGISSKKEWYTNVAELSNKAAKEMYDLYKSKYPNAFYGWYWPWEMYSTKNDYNVFWSDMMNINLDYLTKVDKNMPLLFSPFISKSENASPEENGKLWTEFFKTTRFRKGDIFCPQDSLGTSGYPLKFVEQHIIEMKKASQTNPNVVFWLNCENFVGGDGPDKGNSAPVSRFIKQLQISSKFAENLITFSYSHYYDPAIGAKTEKLDSEYKEYVASLKD